MSFNKKIINEGPKEDLNNAWEDTKTAAKNLVEPAVNAYTSVKNKVKRGVKGNLKDAGNAIGKAAGKVGKGAASTTTKGIAKVAKGVKGITNIPTKIKSIGKSQNIPQEMIIDPGIILAKLHLSGKTQVKDAKCQIVNTGIINDSINPPDKPGKTTFDFNSKNGEYEIGAVIPIEIKVDIRQEKIDKDIGIDLKKLNDAKTKITELKEKQKLTDDNEEVKKAIEEFNNLQSEDKENLKKFYDSLGIKDDPLTDDMSFDKMHNKVISKAQGKYAKDAFDEEKTKARKRAIDSFEEYMKMFAGDLYKAPNEDDLPIVQVPKDFSGMFADLKKYVKDFVIEGMSPEDIEKNDKDEWKKLVDSGKMSKTLCFKIKFKLNKES